MRLIILSYIILVSSLIFSCTTNDLNSEYPINNNGQLSLSSGWELMRSIDVPSSTDEISKPDYNSSTWLKSKVPTTVMNALVKNRVIENPFYGKNLETVDSSLFSSSWYFRKVITLTEEQVRLNSKLNFDGINYRAKVWLNGTLIAGKDILFGSYKTFKLETTNKLKVGDNVVLVEVIAPEPGDFTVGFVDWAPTPPDKNMGLWRPVYFTFSGAVDIKNTFVKTIVNKETLKEAELTIETTLKNNSNVLVNGKLKGKVEGVEFEFPYSLESGEEKTISITANDVADLKITNPRLWWPHDYGSPELYNLKLSTQVDGKLSDEESVRFGIREVEDYFNENGHKGFKVNGKPILIKGAGWVDNLFLADSTFSNKTQLEYVKNMNMNTVRFEGYWGNSQEIYDLCDEMGLLAMVGWSCQWEWEAYLLKDFPEEEELGGVVTKDEMELTTSYFKDMVLWLRNHPSIFTYTAGSDFLPRPELEKMYLQVLEDYDQTRPYLGAAKEWDSPVSGKTGVKMEGPYDWVPPIYWYSDTMRGGAFGFNTETGPGPQPPVLESIKKMIPEADLWPIVGNETWDFHNGRHEFGTMKRYMKGLNNRYGKPKSIEEFAYLSQLQNYESIRPMFEAFSSNKPNSTGVIQWMLNSAWPETFWQQYDYYLVPNGAYYGTRKACTPLTLSYNYATNEIKLVNDTYKEEVELTAIIEVYNANSSMIYSETIEVKSKEFSSEVVSTLRASNEPLQFLKVKLNKGGKEIADNFYWLSLKPDVMDPDYENSSWIYTPTVELADFTLLNSLPKTSVSITKTSKNEFVIKNTGNHIAFGIELKAYDLDGVFVTALVFDDNYFSLMPGEQKVVTIKSYLYKGDLKLESNYINK